MRVLSKLERKYGKYAIPNLTLYLIICYAFGYMMAAVDKEGVIMSYFTLNPYEILHGQIWRLVTWVLIPPSGWSFFTLIMLWFYYSIGKSLEHVWGTFYYNVYMFSGMLFTIVGSFLLYAFLRIFSDIPLDGMLFSSMSMAFSTYYICMSMFLAYAITFPEMQVLLLFVIPIKVKVLGVVYALILAYDVFSAAEVSRKYGLIFGLPTQVAIISSVLNAVIFFIMTKKRFVSHKQKKRQKQFKKQVSKVVSITKHRCAICGKTEVDNPDMEFRFCSKCNGNYEYCSEHLYTHKHVE